VGRSEQERDTTVGVADASIVTGYVIRDIVSCHSSKEGAPRNQIMDYLILELVGDKNSHLVVRKVPREQLCATLVSLALLLRYCRSPVGVI
jgi:hypothetical protein